MTTYSFTRSPNCVQRDDGVLVVNNPPNSDWNAYIAWLAAGNVPSPYVPPPSSIPAISLAQFRALFTPTEWRAVMNLCRSDATTLDWMFQLVAAGSVNMADPLIRSGLDMLVAQGMITSDREMQILMSVKPVF